MRASSGYSFSPHFVWLEANVPQRTSPPTPRRRFVGAHPHGIWLGGGGERETSLGAHLGVIAFRTPAYMLCAGRSFTEKEPAMTTEPTYAHASAHNLGSGARRFIVLCYVCALVFPPLGLVLFIVALRRNHSANGTERAAIIGGIVLGIINTLLQYVDWRRVCSAIRAHRRSARA